MHKFLNTAGVLLALGMSFATAPALAGEDHSPKHGGVMVETKIGDVEVVAKPDVIHIHVTDHGKPIKLAGATAKVTLLNGTEKSEADLVVVGEKLEAKGAFQVAKGTKGIALVTLNGKAPVTARFEIK